jgi:hypothetical protein
MLHMRQSTTQKRFLLGSTKGQAKRQGRAGLGVAEWVGMRLQEGNFPLAEVNRT